MTTAAEARANAIPRRPLGKTGLMVSAIGIGGHHLGEVATVEEAIRIVREAVEAGVNFFDNCWEYYNGRSENWLGRGLEGARDRVILMTKVCTHGRGGDLALKMLDQSLRRLKTDHLDLWQIHGVAFDNDPALAYVKGGVLEAFDAAKKAGKVRFVGFTGHKDPAIHLEMIRRGYPFDAVQMPLNVFDASFRSFEVPGPAGVEFARDRRARDEVDERQGRGHQEGHRHPRGDAPLRDEPAGRHHDRRRRQARRAASKPGHRPGLPADGRPTR